MTLLVGTYVGKFLVESGPLVYAESTPFRKIYRGVRVASQRHIIRHTTSECKIFRPPRDVAFLVCRAAWLQRA